MRAMSIRSILVSAAISLVLFGSAVAQDQWPYYGGNQWHERHAKLTQITREIIAHLVPRRVLQLGATPYSLSASPLVVGGILYVSGSDGMIQPHFGSRLCC
jgi:glucose dehydrogenase